MSNLSAPFLANDRGDVSIYESLDEMVARIEPVDALDGEHEFFDARGTVLDAFPADVRWRLMPSDGDPNPGRLEEVLRSYFARLPQRLRSFTTRAATSSSLSELIEIRLELSRERRPRLGSGR